MTPYVCVVDYEKPDEDEKSVFLRVSYPDTPPLDIELMPVQQALLALALLEKFDMNKIDNG